MQEYQLEAWKKLNEKKKRDIKKEFVRKGFDAIHKNRIYLIVFSNLKYGSGRKISSKDPVEGYDYGHGCGQDHGSDCGCILKSCGYPIKSRVVVETLDAPHLVLNRKKFI